MNRSSRHFPIERLAINAGKFTTLLRRLRSHGTVVFVHGIDGHEIRIEKLDDLWLRERTRPHCEGSASAPTKVDASIVGKEKDWPPVFLCQLKCVANVVGPTDFIEALFLWLRL